MYKVVRVQDGKLLSCRPNLPRWLITAYLPHVPTVMPYPSMPLWACRTLEGARNCVPLTTLGMYEIWKVEVKEWYGNPITFGAWEIMELKDALHFSPSLVVSHDNETFKHYVMTTDVVFCETITLLEKV